MSGESEQVGRHHAGHHIAAEGRLAFPGAAVHTKGPLQKRDHPFDPGPEVSEFLVYPGALNHIRDLKSPLLGEAEILHAQSFACHQILFGRKAAVEGGLTGRATVDLCLPLKHGGRQTGICRIAPDDQAVQDQPAGPTGQADLVTEECFPPLLDDDISMRLEQRDHFLLGRYRLVLENTSFCLIHHPLDQIEIVTQYTDQFSHGFGEGVGN